MQQSMGSQRVRHNLTTEQQQQYIYSLGRLATIPHPRQPFFTGGFNVIVEKTAQSAKYIDAMSKASFLHRKHNTFEVF